MKSLGENQGALFLFLLYLPGFKKVFWIVS